MNKRMNVGIIGCGNISRAYVTGCRLFDAIELTSCADLRMEAAEAMAKECDLKAMTVEELLASPDLDIIINLTIPAVHAEVTNRILESGKHAYSEKPLGLTVAEGRTILETAAKKNLRVGCAPDTFLGAGLQTCRKLIDDGSIGKVIGGTAMMLGAGPEGWHPNPGFFYKVGGGPMFDMGPYYITALIHLLGPVKSVSAVTLKSSETRIATSEARNGEVLPVEVSTHYTGNLAFKSGPVITMVISFDVQAHHHKPIEIYGTEGSLTVPDPNSFGGPVELSRKGSGTWESQTLTHPYESNSRGAGVADMAEAIIKGVPHRCSGQLAFHVLEVMETFEVSSREGRTIELSGIGNQPDALEPGKPASR